MAVMSSGVSFETATFIRSMAAPRRVPWVRRQIAVLGQADDRVSLKERYVEAVAMASDAATDSASRTRRRDLTATMAEVTRVIETEFLAGEREP